MKAVAVVALALVAVSSAAAARSHTRIAVRPGTVSPGAAIHVTGNAAPCRLGNHIYAISKAFPGHQFGIGAFTGLVRAGGAFTITGHVRRTIRAGRYGVTARCGGGNLGVVAYFRIR